MRAEDSVDGKKRVAESGPTARICAASEHGGRHHCSLCGDSIQHASLKAKGNNMDLKPFTMSPDAARREFLAYKAAVANSGTAEDSAIMRGYKEIAAGKRVICLRDVMRAGGLKENGYPNLAIARADQARVFVEFAFDGSCKFYSPRVSRRWSRQDYASGTVINVSADAFPDFRRADGSKRRERKQTVVPIVPPQYRPQFSLKNYHVLFEVDEWLLAPPVDPALLKDLGGGLYAVLAVWDLSPLERAVLGMTRGPGQ